MAPTISSGISNAGSRFWTSRTSWWWGPVVLGILKLQPPPVVSSPAKSPTRAKRVHCPKRNGRNSWSVACRNAGLMESTAETGTRTSQGLIGALKLTAGIVFVQSNCTFPGITSMLCSNCAVLKPELGCPHAQALVVPDLQKFGLDQDHALAIQ